MITILSYKASRAERWRNAADELGDRFLDFVLPRAHIWIAGFFIGLILTSYFI